MRKLFAFIAFALLGCTLEAQQQLAFTFDDLPAHGTLPPGVTRMEVVTSILATLKREHMPPTYGFINGAKVEQSPSDLEVLKAWRNAGQPLGNHTWSHMNFNQHTPAEFEADIQKNEPLLQQLMPHDDWHYLRYPFLWEGDTLEKRNAVRAWLVDHHYKIAHVSMDFEDYLWNDPYARCSAQHNEEKIAWLRKTYLETAQQYIGVLNQLAQITYGRKIPIVLLMHLGAFDAQMLPDLIALYRKNGFVFVTLQQALQDPVYAHDPAIALKYGGTIQEHDFAALRAKDPSLKFPANTKPYKELDAACKTATP